MLRRQQVSRGNLHVAPMFRACQARVLVRRRPWLDWLPMWLKRVVVLLGLPWCSKRSLSPGIVLLQRARTASRDAAHDGTPPKKAQNPRVQRPRDTRAPGFELPGAPGHRGPGIPRRGLPP